MKSMIVLALFVAVAVAGPVVNVYDYKGATILEQTLRNIGVDGYEYSYKTSDGQSASAVATLKNVGSENEALEVRGQYSYIGVDGNEYVVEYIANELGYQPSAPRLRQVGSNL